MAEETNATHAQGTATTTLSAITTGLLALGNGNGLSGLFGGGNSALQQQLSSLQMENATLKAANDVDAKLVSVYAELRSQDKNQDAVIAAIDKRLAAMETAAPLREQIVLGQVNSVAQSLASNNAAVNASIACIQATLAGITKVVVPNTAISPGYGNVTITPATSTTTSSGGSTT